MQANPVIAGAFEASATIIAYSAAAISLSGTVSASESLTLTGVASATLASAGDIDVAVGTSGGETTHDRDLYRLSFLFCLRNVAIAA